MVTCKTRRTLARVPVDAVETSRAITARVAEALIDVMLAVEACSARGTLTLIPIYEVLAESAIEARTSSTLVYLSLAVQPRVAGEAVAGVGVVAIPAAAVVTGRELAVVNVGLTVVTSETWRTLTEEPVHKIITRASIMACSGSAVVNIDLTVMPCEAIVAAAVVVANTVVTETIHTGVARTLVYIYLTVLPRETCNTSITY